MIWSWKRVCHPKFLLMGWANRDTADLNEPTMDEMVFFPGLRKRKW
jgi:hypothetical protein